MSASLVGSEMCIRDRTLRRPSGDPPETLRRPSGDPPETLRRPSRRLAEGPLCDPAGGPQDHRLSC
eukprot:14008291-Alexandrium_andersonii.AAC.1